MQLRHLQTVHQGVEGLQKVTSIAWSANAGGQGPKDSKPVARRMAVVTTDRIVHLFDETGQKQDKFSTKPADAKGPKTYQVKGMAFSPDSSKLAIAQSDNIVFIYKLGLEWGDKKSICNKFLQNSSVTSLTWPQQRTNEVVFGLADGKVKVGVLRSNKSATLYSTDSYVVALSSSPDGTGVISSHLDGSIYRFTFESESGSPSMTKLCNHSCVPYALAWGEHIVAAGNDCKIRFYSPQNGDLVQTFDKAMEDNQKEFTSAVFNPTGESAVVGSYNRFHVFNFKPRKEQWEEVGRKDIENLYTVTALAWKPDGSRLAVGSLCGHVDLYDACIRKYKYKGKFEFTYVSLSQVIVKRIPSGQRIVLKSHFQYEILKINIYQDRYLVAHTPETLLMGDLESCKLSEVPWQGSGREKFYFDNPAVCMVYNAGELSLVEYGRNEVLGSCRTEQLSPHLLSVRINEAKVVANPRYQPPDIKVIAYLIDIQTIRVLNLVTGISVATINHDCRIDWLELNVRASKLLFRDKRCQLHLYEIETGKRVTLLNFCSYVQWVPDSDVVVAQNRQSLCVWYTIDNPDRVTMYTIRGDVEEIERTKGENGHNETKVVVDEGVNTIEYQLDESLIEFGSALEDRDFERAVDFLEPMELTPETEALWRRLSEMSLAEDRLAIAERCFSAVGDVAKARYLNKVRKIAEHMDEKIGDGMNHFRVRAKLSMLNKQFLKAEDLLLANGQEEETMEMYQELHQWDKSIRIAEMKGHPDVENLRMSYYEWLIQTNQEEKAGQLKEQEKDYLAAIHLYLKGGMPVRAAQLVNYHGLTFKPDLLEAISNALIKAGMYEKAGDFLDKLGQSQRALDAYRKGHAYRPAVDLARHHFAQQVVHLEEEWGDYLASQKQMDAATNHYIEAGNYMKAIESSIAAKQWGKAVQIVETQNTEEYRPYLKRIAKHFEDARKYEEAEEYYVKGGFHQDAVDMYSKANKWDAAHKVAVTFLSESEVSMLYITQAQRLESKGKFKEAEKLYLMVKEPDLAINMYKKARQYDNMVRLVSSFRKELLVETHLHLAQQLETEGMFKQAEHHYAEAKDWKSAVNMYRANDMWDDAIRVAKLHGGSNASKQVAYAWAVSLGGEAGSKLLKKFGLIEQAIDYAIESIAFDQAFEMAKTSLKTKLPEVHYKYAMYLEDEGHFKEAEDEFVKAGKPKEAIDMYIHTQDWINAMRLAETFDPPSVSDVLVAKGRVAVERKDLGGAEQLFIRAKKPELAFKMYKENKMFNEALRVAKTHLPHRVNELNQEYNSYNQDQGVGDVNGEELLTQARMREESGQYSDAIDAYLSIRKEHIRDLDQLEEIWEDAVKVAMNHCHGRISEVVQLVSSRLLEISRFEQAAELLESIDKHKDAIDAYIKGSMWDKARSVAHSHAPEHSSYIEDVFARNLASQKNADQLVVHGNIDQGLDTYAQRGEWEKCMELALQRGPDTTAKYAAMFASRLVQEGRFVDAVKALHRYGVSAAAQNHSVYRRVAKEIVQNVQPLKPTPGAHELREVLMKLLDGFKNAGDTNSAVYKEFDRLHLIAYYLNLRNNTGTKGLNELSTRLSIALLRYIHEISADTAFYLAGTGCKEEGWLNMAFMFFNRYLDISEAIEDGDPSLLDADDYVRTDIPVDFPLPEDQGLDESKREEVRDWVLQLSMDQTVAQDLSQRNCDKCQTQVYEACLKCPSCKTECPPCIVSGYPVLMSNRTQCKNCNRFARKKEWNQYVASEKSCPWCGQHASPQY